MSSQRKITKGYGMVTTKIVAAVAILGIFVIITVAVTLKATEPVVDDRELLWFKFNPQENMTSMLATVYVYALDTNYTLLEQFVLVNTTEWQSSNSSYEPGLDVIIFIDFWDIDDNAGNIEYRIGRSPIHVQLDQIIITILSDWKEPAF